MKKILILAYDFPPYVSVGGLRPYSWYKYFKEFGLYPIVVTRQWSNKYGNHLDYIAPGESNETITEETEYGTIIRTPYKPNLSNRLLLKYGKNRFKIIRKIITAYYEFMQFLFFVGPKSGLYYAAKKYLRNNNVDCIIATGSPHILFKYAAKLSRIKNIPWIADYRDPWSQSESRNRGGWMRFWNEYFEKKNLSSAEYFITVSDFSRYQISKLVKKVSFIISNGYDFESNLDYHCKNKNNQLILSFFGTIYKWHTINNVLIVLNEFLYKEENRFIKIRFCGINNSQQVKKFIEDKCSNLRNNVEFFPKMEYHSLIEKLKDTDLLLLFNDYSLVGTKIYDCLALRKKILFCYKNERVLNPKLLPYYNNEIIGISNRVQEEIILETSSGIIVNDSKHLLEVLEQLKVEFDTKGFIECKSTGIEKYSRYYQTKKLADLIKSI